MKLMAAAVIIREGKILLVHNTKQGLRIEPPGGKAEEGESVEDCAIRETKEELGITVEPKYLIGNFPTDTPEGRFNVFLFKSDIVEGEPSIMEPDKISEFKWYDRAGLKDVDEFLVSNIKAGLKHVWGMIK